ncbi:MAG: hypothetical protein ACQCN5_04485 [Candidatus Bathyarchaeia archaeon]
MTLYSLALKTAIDEIKNVTPEVSCAFVFKQDGEVIAQDDDVKPKVIQEAIQFFNEMTSRMDAVGGFDNLSIRGSTGQVTFTECMDGFYLGTVSSKMVDEKTLFVLNHIVVPVIIKVIEQMSQNSKVTAVVEATEAKLEEPKQEQHLEETKPETAPVVQPEKIEEVLPKAPVHQFMVEKISGLLVASDTVRIDADVITSWDQLYEGRFIDHVTVESLKMKKITCKFKPIKETRNTAKGIVQVPERILQTLEVSKGELVMITPVI